MNPRKYYINTFDVEREQTCLGLRTKKLFPWYAPVLVIPLDAKSVEELRLKVKLGMGKLLGSEWFTDEATFLALEALGITAKQPRAAEAKYHKRSAVIPTGGKVSQPRAGQTAKLKAKT